MNAPRYALSYRHANAHRRTRARTAAALLGAALALAGCQGLGGPGAAGVDLDRAMPGEIARERYAHVARAIDALGKAFSDGGTGLDALAWDAAPARLVERELLDAGPYRLVAADPATGRLEYRSARTGRHLSATVRAPEPAERADGAAFVVAEMVGLAPLSALVRAGNAPDPAVLSPVPVAASRLAPGGDAELLARLDALDRVEREREDLLALRAMLELRLGRDDRAGPLVERGIVRYPDSPLYFALAERLFAGADGTGEVPASLSRVVRARFDRDGIGAGRRELERFVAGGAGA